MLRARPLSTLPRSSLRLSRPLILRHVSNKSKTSTTPDFSKSPGVIEESLIQHTLFTVDYFKRFLKYTAVGLVAVGLTTWTAFEGAHFWVELKELVPETDPEARQWEWNKEAERWTGGPSGGTDPGLGFFGRNAVRSAWMSLNWGTGSTSSVINSQTSSGRGDGSGSLNVVESRLEFAQAFLNVALGYALQKSESGKLRPETLLELLQRRASVMELMGSRDNLFESRREMERVWSMLPGNGIDAARAALKLGDLNQRLGDRDDALAWWSRAIQLVQTKDSKISVEIPPSVPGTPPISPLGQRTLISTLVSLSAFYATTGQLRQARDVQEASLNLLRSLPQPSSFETTSPAHALHAMYILHRSSLLSIHHAEVLYALRSKPNTSIEWLIRAAESSERVAFTLTGLPLTHPDAPGTRIPHPPSSETPLLETYAKSVSMKKPARHLLRDSRRTAAEAWNLLGVLAESSSAPGSTEKALQYYERALGWAGVSGDRAGGIGKAGEGTLEAEWKTLWNNYVRTRDAVKKVSE
ncbi:hypothetical protein QCA50_003117 [Cerrena zonata]|uniref:Uncharacterized protein n=1 Tax=Cerrena zonata TaxID=2478898 RepID=A0AAW0GJL8_9APHY